jgi:hypothetical protein
MADLAQSVDDLLRAAVRGAEPKAMRRLVETVLAAFEDAEAPAREKAVRSMGRALGKAHGRSADVLALALGALVESGARPDTAWKAIAPGLAELFANASSFATRAMKHAKSEDVEGAIQASGAAIAKKYPAEAEAWNAVPARALAGLACLTRSAALRKKAGATLLAAAWPLAEVMEPAFDFVRALRVLDDKTLLVLAPEQARGWKMIADGITTNAELFVLVADALAGGPKDRRLPGKRPPARAVKALHEARSGAVEVDLPFHFLSSMAIGSDGGLLPDAEPLDPDGAPADLPSNVLVLAPGGGRLVAETPFATVKPSVRVADELSPSDVVRALLAIARRD